MMANDDSGLNAVPDAHSHLNAYIVLCDKIISGDGNPPGFDPECSIFINAERYFDLSCAV